MRTYFRTEEDVHLLRSVFFSTYYRLIHYNYRHQLIATRQRTCAGTFDSYELYNRHGNDKMLASLEAYSSSDSIIYDVGANVGIYALALAADAPGRTIIAVEPSRLVADQLLANVALNDFHDRIIVLQCGFGAEVGRRAFHNSSYTELSAFNSESANRWEAEVASVESVPVRTIDDAVKEYPPPDIIKIDVEGSAAAVLEGARDTLSKEQPTIFLEPHREGLSGEEPLAAKDILNASDYRIEKRVDFWIATPVNSNRN